MSVAGVRPGSTLEEPLAYGTDQPKSSEPINSRLASACAAQKLAEAEGYSG